MKPQRFIAAALILSALSLAGTTLAADVGITNPLKGVENIPDLLTKVAGAVGDLVVALGTIMVVVSGIMFLMTGGDPSKMAVARSALVWACLGILLGSATTAITDFVYAAAAGNKVSEVLSNIIIQVGGLMIGLGTISMVIAGFFYMFSAGDATKVQTAKRMILYSLIGIVIGVAAEAIVATVKSLAG